jgi:hypothetical protein
MKKRYLVLLSIFCVMLTLSGCVDYQRYEVKVSDEAIETSVDPAYLEIQAANYRSIVKDNHWFLLEDQSNEGTNPTVTTAVYRYDFK